MHLHHFRSKPVEDDSRQDSGEKPLPHEHNHSYFFVPEPNDRPANDISAFAARALSQWATNIADRIRNPVAGVRAAVEIIEKQIHNSGEKGQLDRDMVTKALQLSRERLQDLDRYVTELVTLAQPAVAAERKIVDPTTILNQVAEESMAIAEWSGHIAVVTDPNVRWLVCDPIQITAMLRALISNGAEAVTPANIPSLSLSIKQYTGPIPSTIRARHQKWAAISVCDNGIGMAPEDFGKLRMPFMTTKEARAGFGIALVEKVTAAHGGFIAIQRCHELGGTQVSVMLPNDEVGPTHNVLRVKNVE